MPERTIEDVACGVVGFTVVRARRNSSTPATAITIPVASSNTAVPSRQYLPHSRPGVHRASNHMHNAATETTATGGTRSSSNDPARTVSGLPIKPGTTGSDPELLEVEHGWKEFPGGSSRVVRYFARASPAQVSVEILRVRT
jgi:hypothetical protein